MWLVEAYFCIFCTLKYDYRLEKVLLNFWLVSDINTRVDRLIITTNCGTPLSECALCKTLSVTMNFSLERR